MIITVSGTDGAGKTEQIKRLMRSFDKEKIEYRTLYVRGTTTPLVSLYKRLFCKRKVTNFRIKTAFFLSKLELIFNWCIRIKLLDRKKRVILCDRYIFDTDIDFAEKMGEDFRKGALWKFLVRHAARPDLSLYYSTDEKTISERLKKKGESEEQEKIAARLHSYEEHFKDFDAIIDASGEADEVYRKTAEIVMPLAKRRSDTPHLRRAKRIAAALSEDKTAKVSAEPITEGESGAHCYALCIGKEKKYFLKIYSRRRAPYEPIASTEAKNIIVFPLKNIRISPFESINISEWIDGSPIEKTKEEAARLAETVKRLHSVETGKLRPASIRKETLKYIAAIKLSRIDFAHKKEIFAYIKRNMKIAKCTSPAILHLDLHSNNIIVDREGKIRLIDPENTEISDPLREFVYAAFFRDEKEVDFWQDFLHAYFKDGVSEDQREKFAFYCHIHALRMITCNHRNKNYEDIARIAESIYLEFHQK